MAAIRLVVLVFACTALSAACAPVAPELSTRSTEALLGDARAAGGREDPSAAYYMELAERELYRARALVRAHDPEGAASWARRADADADVARMLAVEAAVRASAQRTIDQANALSQQIEAGR